MLATVHQYSTWNKTCCSTIHNMYFFSVSMMAANEYEGLQEQLDLEQSLRQKAETYAHEVS